MGLPPNKPIRLTETQTELLTRALAEAAQEAGIPKASETDTVRKHVAAPIRPAAQPPKKTTII